MQYAYLQSINENAFRDFVNAPTSPQIDTIATVLKNAEEYQPPWEQNPREWISDRLAATDWYGDLDVGEPVVWELAICELVKRPEFELQQSHAERSDCTLPDAVFAWSKAALTLLDQPAVLRNFAPYRYFNSEEQELELTFWPSHALLTNDQVGQMIEELNRFDQLIEVLEKARSGFKDMFREELTGARQALTEATPALVEIHNQGRMLFAPFEI